MSAKTNKKRIAIVETIIPLTLKCVMGNQGIKNRENNICLPCIYDLQQRNF